MQLPSAQEFARGIYGAWRLALLDRDALRWFDRSPHGVWRSFWAAALAYPGFLVATSLHLLTSDSERSLPAALLIESIAYVFFWAAFLLAVIPFCRWLRRDAQCLDFVIAYNWSQVLQTGLWLIVELVSATRLLPDGAVVLLGLIALVLSLGYEWFIARVAIAAGNAAAFTVVLFDFVLTIGLGDVARALY